MSKDLVLSTLNLRTQQGPMYNFLNRDKDMFQVWLARLVVSRHKHTKLHRFSHEPMANRVPFSGTIIS